MKSSAVERESRAWRKFLMSSRDQRELLQHGSTQALQLKNARRVWVTGNAGAGKTRLAQQLAAQMEMPYIGLDLVVWKPGWVPTPRAERHRQESAIASIPRWIVDGVSLIILDAADVVVFLDYPRPVCFWRAMRRNVPYLFRSRPGLPENCPEIRVVPTLLKIIWRFPIRLRPMILDACISSGKPLIRVRSHRDLDRLLDSMGATGA